MYAASARRSNWRLRRNDAHIGNSIGLVTTGDAQVIHLRGDAIPGLYACGDVVALEHVGVGFQAGLPLAGAMTFGWLAAQHAAQKFF
jgi:3-oxosteroid 1-dehydrogenase